MKNKLIIYELNELPKKLINYYINLKPSSNLAYIFKKGIYLDTFTTDKGELHPWSTWPTFYRGVDNSFHQLKFINQEKEIANNYPPVWEILKKNNISIGIFGTLQSYPPLKGENIKFYLPDTFAPSSEAYPNSLQRFQKFNLRVCANNSAVSKSIGFKEILNFINCLINNDLGLINTFKIIWQVIKEFKNNLHKKRRSLLQPMLSFYIFNKLLNKTKPDFCTFFTNHLAGMMHRYWLDVFPKDFKNPYRESNQYNKNSVILALDIADKQIGKLIKFAESNSYELWIASSMGQEAIEREKKEKLFINDHQLFIKKIGLDPKKYLKLPSMYPDLNIKCNSLNDVNILTKKLKKIKTLDGKEVLSVRYSPNKETINLLINAHKAKVNLIKIDNKEFKINEVGLSILPEMVGTGYHIPNGILMAYGGNSKETFKDFDSLITSNMMEIILKKFKAEK